MAINYGFFNSVGGDRKYNADDISNYFLKLISNGVFATPANAMQVTASAGMTVTVSAGWGFINCKWVENTAPYMLTLDAADVVLNRIDRIVIRLDASNATRSIVIAVKKGQLNSEPTPPTLERVAGGVWELSLAQIAVDAGATEITQADITDERGDTELCGYVTGLIDQIDTTGLFIQYNAAFNAWFEAIKGQLSEDAAGNLQNQINLQNGYISNYAPVELYSYDPTDDDQQVDNLFSLSEPLTNFERVEFEYSVIDGEHTFLTATKHFADMLTNDVYVHLVQSNVEGEPSSLVLQGYEAEYKISAATPDKMKCIYRRATDNNEYGNIGIRIWHIYGYGNRNAPPVVTQPYNETQVDNITDSVEEVTE